MRKRVNNKKKKTAVIAVLATCIVGVGIGGSTSFAKGCCGGTGSKVFSWLNGANNAKKTAKEKPESKGTGSLGTGGTGSLKGGTDSLTQDELIENTQQNETVLKEVAEKNDGEEKIDTDLENIEAEMGKVYEGAGKESEAFYKPKENASMDYNNESSRYCFSRSRESDHFYVFWEAGFGSNPNASSVPEKMRVDIDDLLEKAELFYYTNVNKLHMTDGKLINGYKMQIYLLYQEEWLATGSGYDDTIGALWVNPSTCQPVGSTIAHEIGHSFQYMIAANQLAEGKSKIGETGFRYGYPNSKGGNAFWEVCAQWQAYNVYPEESFTWYHMDTWFANYHRALENELCRYQNYWWLYYASEKNDINVLQKIWKESKNPDDALGTYKRIYLNDDLDEFYNQMYEYASKATTFDFDAIRQYSDNYQGKYETKLYPMGDGYSQVAYANCPEANGFNAIKLDAKSGKKVTVDFKGLEAGSSLANEDPGKYMINAEASGSTRKYNSYSGKCGWRYGFVALQEDGKRVYSEMASDSKGTVSFDIPENTKYAYFVVLGAPDEYVCHAWDDDEINDVQMPYAVKISYN